MVTISYFISLFLVSVVTLGKQMVPVLNSLHIQAAVYGNHDFGKSLKRVLILHCKLYYILSQIFSPLIG